MIRNYWRFPPEDKNNAPARVDESNSRAGAPNPKIEVGCVPLLGPDFHLDFFSRFALLSIGGFFLVVLDLAMTNLWFRNPVGGSRLGGET